MQNNIFTIETNKSEYVPGETIQVRIRIKSEKPIKARAVYAVLYCDEVLKKVGYMPINVDEKRRMEELGLVVTSPVKPVEVFQDKTAYKNEKKLCGPKELQLERYEISFDLPKNAESTSYIFGHDDKKTIWKVKARIDIAFAPDFNAEKEIIVNSPT